MGNHFNALRIDGFLPLVVACISEALNELYRRKRTDEMGTRQSWTPERRIRQRQAIQRTRPWDKSTGPRTPEGKAIASQNAKRSSAQIFHELERLEQELAEMDVTRVYCMVPQTADTDAAFRAMEKRIVHLENELRRRARTATLDTVIH